MKHDTRVKVGAPTVHQVSGVAGPMFFPLCSCGWEGAWMLTSLEAKREGEIHVRTANAREAS